ncbi:MAG: hypothetical protein ABIS03_07400 [Gemmatimonadaceae bacterium]
MKKSVTLSLSVLFLAVAATGAQKQSPASRFSVSGCDAGLWKRVYNPARLHLLSSCISVTGVVEESVRDDDGDQHFLLKLDKGYKTLVNSRNKKKKRGDLVVEIVCANPVKLKKVNATCTGFTNPIGLPLVGSHVRVTGSWVIDSHNGWTEIHPASAIRNI